MVHFSASGPAGILESSFIVSHLKSEIHPDDHDSEHQAHYPGIDLAKHLNGFAVFVVIQPESLEDSGEAVSQMEPNHHEKHQVGNDDMQDLEFLTGLVIEVGLDFKSGGLKNSLVLFVEVGEPILLGRVFAVLLSIADGV